MTGLVTLVDEGQNYIEFDIICDIINAVRPSGLAGWRGTRIINTDFEIGDQLKIDLQWDDYDCPLNHKIVSINVTEVTGDAWLVANMSDVPALYTNPTTNLDHWAYVVSCNGIPFYFDCVSAPAVAAANALLSTDKIPSVLLDILDGMQLVGESSPTGSNVVANIVDRLMTIFGNRTIDEGIIAHETTHPWAQDKWGSTTPPADTDYIAAINSGEPPVSEYAKTSPGEDLAETIRMYVINKGKLLIIAPLRYAVVDRLMTDPSYYG